MAEKPKVEIPIKAVEKNRTRIEYLESTIESLKQEVRQDEKALEKVLTHFLGTALALAAALLWKDAIISTLKKFIPSNQSWEWEIMLAIIFTIFASAVILYTTRWSHRK